MLSTLHRMLHADDVDIISKSTEALAKMMTAIAHVFEAAGLTVSEKKTENMLLRTHNMAPLTSPLAVEAAGLRNKHAIQILVLGNCAVVSARPTTL